MLSDKGFTITRKEAERLDYIIVHYLFESETEPEKAAILLAKEQSLSQWPGSGTRGDEIIRTNAAKVVEGETETLETDGKTHRAKAKIAFPSSNIEGNIAALVNNMGWDTHAIAMFKALRIEDVEFTPEFLQNYSGPTYGIDGLRRLLDAHERPLFCGPVKPCVGLTPDEFAKQAYEAASGGLDIIKDDELIVDPPYCPFEERVKKTVRAVREAEQKTGKRKIYVAHIGGAADKIEHLYERAKQLGADAVMFDPAINGVDIISRYSKRGELAILSHNAFMFASTRAHDFGMSLSLWSKLQRICGADVIITTARHGVFGCMNDEQNQRNIRACLDDMMGVKKNWVALAGSQGADTLPIQHRYVGSPDFILVSGYKVYGHPLGPAAGAKSLVQAWEAIRQGIKLEDYTKEHQELKLAIEQAGRVLY